MLYKIEEFNINHIFLVSNILKTYIGLVIRLRTGMMKIHLIDRIIGFSNCPNF